MSRKFVIHAPGGLGYYLVKAEKDDPLTTHLWHHGNYGLNRARKFPSAAAAKPVLRKFRDAGGHPARVFEVVTRRAYCATTCVGKKVYWLCPGLYPDDGPRWRSSAGAPHEAPRFDTPSSAYAAARRVRLPEGAEVIKTVPAIATFLLK